MTEEALGTGAKASNGRPLRYRRAPGARISPGRATPAGTQYLLRTPSGQQFELGEEERFLWDALDGVRSFEAIERGFRARFGSGLVRADFLKFIEELAAAGAVERLPDGEVAVATDIPSVRRITLGDQTGADAAAAAGAEQPRQRRRRGQRREVGQAGALRTAMRDLWSCRLGNPENFFAALAAVYWPVRYIGWLLIPLTLIAFMITMKHSKEYIGDLAQTFRSIPVWPCLWLAEHVTTWSARAVEGVIIHGFGGRVRQLDAKLFLGLFVRAHLDETSLKSMTRRQRLWIESSPLTWRLFLFSIEIIIWAETRPTQPTVAKIALFMAFIALVTFAICSCPLIPMYGYRVLSTLLEQEQLYGRAFRFFWLKLRGRPTPYTMTLAERWGLVFMAGATALFTTLYIGHILYSADVYSIMNLSGLGGVFAVIILSSCALYFIALWRMAGRLRAMHRVDRVAQGDPEMPRPPFEL